MFKLCLIFIFVESTIACGGPLTGALSTNPTFQFTFYPPLSWTYYDGTTAPTGLATSCLNRAPGQWADSASALRYITNAIQVVSYQAAAQFGISSTANLSISGYTPLNALVEPQTLVNGVNCSVAGTYIAQLNSITQAVTATTSKYKPFSQAQENFQTLVNGVNCSVAGTYIAQLNSITQAVTATGIVPYKNTMTVSVSNNLVAYYHSQWVNFATYVQNQLSTNYGVIFVGSVVITP
uniref:Uncharacterized protein n=1 Tax=Acrobeloides nanus TaxID=290746 RepID=A0A914E2B0_9BILA